VGANDDDERRPGHAPPAKRTQYGIAVPTPGESPPQTAPRVPVATPQPAAHQRTTYGVPSPAARPQVPVTTPRPPARQPTPQPTHQPPHRPPTPEPHHPPAAVRTDDPAPAYQTRLGTGPVVAQQPPRQTPATMPAVSPGSPIAETRFGTGPVTAPRGPATPAPSHATTGTHELGAASAAHPPQEVVASGMGLEAGARIHQYELMRELGRGGMGMVWAARDTKLGRRVAIKFLLDASRAVADRFLTEARATAQCNHENIVIIHEVDEVENMPYMVLEFLEGQPMRGLMGTYGSGTRVPPSRVVELMLPVARALARAHELGIVHRDLKPENVFVTNAGQVKVLDFGIAKAVATREAAPRRTQMGDLASMGNMNLTREGALVGTLPYMSPEQMGVDEVDHRSDLWAVGIMMFEMLSGQHPISPLTAEALISNAISDDPMTSIRELVPEVPDALASIVEGCLRKRVAERIPGAADLARRLEELMPGRAGRQLAEGESPYPGLTAFHESDADRFFGRTRDIARMTARVRELPITGIVGPSGVGKSSFIRAGVGPALKASGERWDVVTLRPGRQPLAALSSVVQKLTTRSGTNVEMQVEEHHQLMNRLRNEPGFVGTLLRARARQSGGQILLFVDQFEELYTLVPDANERRAFTAALTGVADDTAAPLRVVVSMRSDFLDRIAEDQRFMEELSRGLVFLQPPDANGLREALVSPVEMVGHRFESAAMIEDMLAALVNTPGALPLLQFAASKLWDARDRQRRLLTVASYNAIGGITGALATHADDIVAQMNDRQQKLTQKIFRRLVTPERTRAIVELADLYQLAPDRAEVSRTLDQLVAARLLVVQTRGDAGGGSAEIVHESLIERWPTLGRWLDEDQEDAAFLSQLAAAAKQWEAKGHAAGLLWRGDAMEEARLWFNARPRELPAREKAFLDAVFSLARRGKRVRRVLLTITFIVLGTVAAGAMVAFVWIRGAEQEASENAVKAEQKQKEAEKAAQIAEEEKLRAEKALADQKAAEAAKAQIEGEKKVVEAAKASAETKVAETAEELKQKNEQLELKIAEANAAKDRAEKERAKAEAATAEVKKAKRDLEDANARLQAENERIKKQSKGLAKELKGFSGSGGGSSTTPAPTPAPSSGTPKLK
jgi:serine/threonine protein kinase